MSGLLRLIQYLSACTTLLVVAPLILAALGLVFLLASFAAMMITGIIRQYYWGLRPFADAATVGEWLLSVTVYGTVWLVTFRIFDMKTGISSLFRSSSGGSHGSARFATRKERATFAGGDGLLIGRDCDTAPRPAAARAEQAGDHRPQAALLRGQGVRRALPLTECATRKSQN